MIRNVLITFFITLSLFGVDIGMTQAPMETNQSIETPQKAAVFGANLFKGHFAKNNQVRFNPKYRINVGDEIVVVFWGAFDAEYRLKVDSQGNIFIPKVGVINVLGVEAGKLNKLIQQKVRKVFKDNVFVYANVLGFQPVSDFVTGSVNLPGLYEGLSSDSVVQFLDRAGGIELEHGSFRDIAIKRDGKVVRRVDLYDFLLGGHLDLFQFKNGDVIVVGDLRHYFYAKGDVKRPYRFETTEPTFDLGLVKKYALPNQTATHAIVYHWNSDGVLTTVKYSLSQQSAAVHSGDVVEFIAEHDPKKITIRLEGEVYAPHVRVVERETTLANVLNHLRFTPIANKEAVQLYRKSVAKLQKELIEAQLRDLEAKVLAASSITTEGSKIRKEEAQLIMEFIKRARAVKPKGKVVLNDKTDFSKVVLEDEDIIFVPKRSSVVTIQGEVKIPGAQTYVPGHSVKDYIRSVGGFSDRADKEHILIIRQNGKVLTYDADSVFAKKIPVYPGDSILVLGRPNSENLQITKDIAQIVYQIAVSTGVLLQVF